MPKCAVQSSMKRVSGLDGVRGLAIAWVLLYHLYALLPKAPALAALPGINRLANVGWIGVCLFFTLSGYLIVPLLAADRDEPRFLARFWCRRIARLVPLYAVLLGSFLVAARFWPESGDEHTRLFETTIPYGSYWLFAQNVPMAAHGYFGNEWLRVTWSLAVEMQFYLLIASAVYFVPRRALPTTLLVLSAGAVLVRYAVVASNPGANAPLVLLLPCRLDAFLLGGWLALRTPRDVAARSPVRAVVAVLVLAASAAGFVMFSRGYFGGFTRWVVPLYYLMLTTASMALIELAAGSSRWIRWGMESKPLVRAGRLSYFLYLFHLPVLWTIYRVGFHRAPALNDATDAAIIAIVLVVLWGSAEVSQRFLEAPLIRWAHGRLTVRGSSKIEI